MNGSKHSSVSELQEPPRPEGDPLANGESREKTLATLRLLWRRRRWIGRVAFYGLLGSALLAFLQPAQYQSTARLMPPDDGSDGRAILAAAAGRAPGLGVLAGDLLGVKNTGAVFVGILRSRTVQDRMIQQFGLLELYGYSRLQDARKKLEQRTTVAEDRKSGIIEITVTDNDPQRARAMAQAYTDELNRVVAEVSTSAARRERTFIEQRLQVAKQELDQAAQEFSQFASKNIAIDIAEQGRAMVEAAATLQGQWIVAQTELESLKQIYSDQNVRVRAAQARIRELKQQLRRLGGSDATGSGTAGADDLLYPSIRKLPLLGVTYADLYRRTKVAEIVYELLVQQHEMARVQEARDIPTVSLLDAPQVPETPVWPPRLLLTMAGGFLSLAAGTAWLAAAQRWEASAGQPAQAFAQEVWSTLKATAPWAPRNGRSALDPDGSTAATGELQSVSFLSTTDDHPSGLSSPPRGSCDA